MGNNELTDPKQRLLRRRTEEKNTRWWILFAVISSLAVWFSVGYGNNFYFYALGGNDWLGRSGTFGDSFGYANSLLSGLALAGVIIAILLQTRELRYQREEIDDTQGIMQQTQREQEASTAALLAQAEVLQEQADMLKQQSELLGLTAFTEVLHTLAITSESFDDRKQKALFHLKATEIFLSQKLGETHSSIQKSIHTTVVPMEADAIGRVANNLIAKAEEVRRRIISEGPVASRTHDTKLLWEVLNDILKRCVSIFGSLVDCDCARNFTDEVQICSEEIMMLDTNSVSFPSEVIRLATSIRSTAQKLSSEYSFSATQVST